MRPRRGLASDECQEVRIDHVGIRGHHAVREAGVVLERAMLEQLRLQQCSVFVGDNLIIVALHHEGRHCGLISQGSRMTFEALTC